MQGLRFPVSCSYNNFFGLKSRISFRPTERNGWFWEFEKGQKPIRVSADLIRCQKRRVTLEHESKTLNIYEHIGVLRMMGLDGVVISSDSWPPYFGRSLDFYNFLKPAMVNLRKKSRWCTVAKEISFCCDGSSSRFTTIIPGHEKTLELIVICDYKGIGRREMQFRFPDSCLLEKILGAYTQGWPQNTFYLGWFFSKLGWPHMNKVIWARGCNNEEVLNFFILHRALDLLGTLSLIHPTRLLSGTVVSHLSGHSADVKAVKASQGFIDPID